MKDLLPDHRTSTGISGLDGILCGGLVPQRAYLLRGGPGSGKTTLGLHFLAAGVAAGESVLYITLEESEANIRSNASRLGMDTSSFNFLDLGPSSSFFSELETYDIFSPAEVEREPITTSIVEAVKRFKPARVFVDPMTQLRYLSSDVFNFRRQVLSFIRLLVEHGASVVYTSEHSPEAPDDDLQFMSDGVIELGVSIDGRTISVVKHRASNAVSGLHAMRLTDSGMEVYPRMVPSEHRKAFSAECLSSGVTEIDQLLNGGIERGTITILTGPTGVGKTTLGLQFMKEAAVRGERSVVYSFEEDPEIMIHRAQSIGIPAREMINRGNLVIQKIEPLRWSPYEFAQLVRREVEEHAARIVMIDSVAGYELTLRGKDLASHLHALTKYLQNMNVAVLLLAETSAVVGEFKVTDVGISYMGDNVVFLRYLEIQGDIRKAIGVLKKRMSNFEKKLREFEITSSGIKVGKPLSDLRGILLGTPEWIVPEERGKT